MVGLTGSLGLAILLVKKIEIVIFSKTQARAHPNVYQILTSVRGIRKILKLWGSNKSLATFQGNFLVLQCVQQFVTFSSNLFLQLLVHRS